MISIDEAIAKLRSNAIIDKYNMCGYSMQQHEQIAEWLEELKDLREIKEAIECNAEVLEQQGYNKAIDDFVKKLEKNSHYLEGHYGAIYEEDIYNISVQLKVGRKHE